MLATASKSGKPNANIVISLGFVDNKLLVADCQMETTIANPKQNDSISVVGGYFRIRGKAKIYNSGKYFDACKKANDGYEVKHAIAITADDVFDLDKQQKVA